MKSLTLIAALGLAPAAALAQEDAGDGMRSEPQPSRWASNHSIVVDGETVAYEAVVGSVILRDNEANATGELFYTGYFRTNGGDPSTRPIIFAYNGGPGSASFWLHMGIMGPRRVVTPNIGQQAPPAVPARRQRPYRARHRGRRHGGSDRGPAFSRPAGDADGTDFWGMDEDAASLTQFIRRFLSENQRWNSPRYILGESYGTTRSVLLARHLQSANIDLNGIVLVSAVIDFNTLQFSAGVAHRVHYQPPILRRRRGVPRQAAGRDARTTSRRS